MPIIDTVRLKMASRYWCGVFGKLNGGSVDIDEEPAFYVDQGDRITRS